MCSQIRYVYADMRKVPSDIQYGALCIVRVLGSRKSVVEILDIHFIAVLLDALIVRRLLL